MRLPSVVSSQRYTFMRVVAAIMTTAKYRELSSCPPLEKDETTIIIIKNMKKNSDSIEMDTQKVIIVVLRRKSMEFKICLFLGLSLFLQRVLALFLS